MNVDWEETAQRIDHVIDRLGEKLTPEDFMALCVGATACRSEQERLRADDQYLDQTITRIDRILNRVDPYSRTELKG